MFFLIKEVLEEVKKEELDKAKEQYVVIMSTDEWMTNKDSFDMGMDFEPDTNDIYTTMAEVNYDSSYIYYFNIYAAYTYCRMVWYEL